MLYFKKGEICNMKNLKKALATSLAILNIFPAVNGAEMNEPTPQEETCVQEKQENNQEEDKANSETNFGDFVLGTFILAAMGIGIKKSLNFGKNEEATIDTRYTILEGSSRSLPAFNDYKYTRDLVYKLYSFRNVRNIIDKNFSDKKDEYIDALKYLFEVMQGDKEYNLDLIRKSYDKLTDNGRIFYKHGNNSPSFIDKMYRSIEKDNLKFAPRSSARHNSLERLLIENCPQRDIVDVEIVRDNGNLLKHGRILKDFEELNINGNVYELGYVKTKFGNVSTIYLKHYDGTWHKYENLSSKQVSSQEVINNASTLGVNLVYNKRA